MGIRFYCPNGHKLNVKQFQAGHRGICPYCGEKTEIPATSTREPSRRMNRASASTGKQVPPLQPDRVDPVPSRNRNAEVPQDRLQHSPSPRPDNRSPPTTIPGTPNPAPPSVGLTLTDGGHAASSMREPSASPTASVSHAAPTPSKPPNPLDEDTNVAWYVRPPSGGQFGPANGDVMRTWLAEGRIDDESLVWREGWRDWQEARHVFPQLRPDWIDAATGGPVSQVLSGPFPRSPRKSQKRQLAFVASLVAIVVFLVITLVLVLLLR